MKPDDTEVFKRHKPIQEILKNILKPLKPLKKPPTPKIIKNIFKEPVAVDFDSHSGMESLIANPQPSGGVSDEVGSTIALGKNLPVELDVPLKKIGSQDTLKPTKAVKEDLPRKATPNKEEEDDEDMFDIEKLLSDLHEELGGTSEEEEKEDHKETPRGLVTTTAAPPPSPEPVTTAQYVLTTTSPRPTLPTVMTQVGTPKKKEKKKKPKQPTKETMDLPSLDRIAEKVFERYKNHDDIPSYEDLWYDDRGDLLLSQEHADPVGRNVKRQVENGNPDPTAVIKPKDEIDRLHEITDTLDRFRMMLDLAQQVEFYLTKRLQAGINALSAIYSDGSI